MGLLSKLPLPLSKKKGWPWTTETKKKSYDTSFKYPKITIVTPSYNQGQFIEETIRSVLLQNYPNLEYIIIDGGSTDDTVSIIKKYEPWLTYWVSEKDRGQSHALNKGFAKGNGTWLNWINSDDLLAKDALLSIFSNTILNKQIIIATGLITDEDLNVLRRKQAIPLVFNNLISWGPSPSQPSVFFKRKLYDKLTIKEDFHYTMDWRLWVDTAHSIPLEQQLILPNVDVGISRYWPGIKSLKGTFDKGYQEVQQTILEYSNKGVELPKDINRLIFDKRKVFIRTSKTKSLVFFIVGFFKFYKIKYIKDFIKTLLFFEGDGRKNL